MVRTKGPPESLVLSGFPRIFFLNGHGGNDEVVGMVTRDLARSFDVTVGGASYWTLSRARVEPILQSEEIKWFPGHAGAFETACTLALRPDLMSREDLPDASPAVAPRSGPLSGAFVDGHRSIEAIGGYTDAPRKATAEIGRQCLDVIAECVAEALVDFHRLGRNVLG